MTIIAHSQVYLIEVVVNWWNTAIHELLTKWKMPLIYNSWIAEFPKCPTTKAVKCTGFSKNHKSIMYFNEHTGNFILERGDKIVEGNFV